MQHLPFPVTAHDDEAEIIKLAKKPYWEPFEANWITRYREYCQNSGSPFLTAPYSFGEGVGDFQYSLYDTRKSSGELRRMRKKKGLKSCPMCGSPCTGDLDHYLPRMVYPEFSIMRANLVPACTHCNSGVKGTTIHGDDPERFIHPYFDEWAAHSIWYVEILPPFKAARFCPRSLPDLAPPRGRIVDFHLKNVLGEQFQRSMANYWSTLPLQITMRVQLLTLEGVIAQVDKELDVAVVTNGPNSWLAALLRGIQCNPDALNYLHEEAIVSVIPP